MASSDTMTDSSSEDYKRKSSKKHKRKNKTEKKHKKSKVKKEKKSTKRRKMENSSSDDGNTSRKLIKVGIDLIDAFGPALPPHLAKKSSYEQKRAIIGPTMPSNLATTLEVNKTTISEEPRNEMESANHHSESDEGGIYGPIPTDDMSGMNSVQIELEQRALQLKISAIDGNAQNDANADQNEREEWMLELPEVGLKGGLAALSNMKRTFYSGKERPDFSDRSSWTKTPSNDKNPQKASTSKSAADALKTFAQQKYDRERDAEQERLAKKHKKKHKHEESLVELHQKKLRKEQKKKEKELLESGAKPERRPFSRDVDLKLNKIDSNQTKQIVDKAKILNTKFASGHTKYL